MKILIIGATGNVSSHIAETLTGRHPEIDLRLTSTRSEGEQQLKEKFSAAEVVRADYYDPDSLRAALAGVDKVSVVPADGTEEQRATPNLIGAVRDAGSISQLVRLLAYPPGRTFADLAPELIAAGMGPTQHLTAKPLLEASGIPLTLVNATAWYMTNLPWLAGPRIRERRELVLPYPRSVTWLDPAEIGEAIAGILTDETARHIGKEYLLTGKERLSFSDAASVLSRTLGCDIRYSDAIEPFREMFGEGADAFLEFFRVDQHAYDDTEITDTMETLLGRAPCDLEQWVAAHTQLFS